MKSPRASESDRRGRRDEIMYHVGRPGEDGFTESILAAWGVDGHTSHTTSVFRGRKAISFGWDSIVPAPIIQTPIILLISAH